MVISKNKDSLKHKTINERWNKFCSPKLIATPIVDDSRRSYKKQTFWDAFKKLQSQEDKQRKNNRYWKHQLPHLQKT